MSRTDIISDAFTIIRNAARAKKEDTLLPFSRSVSRIADILKKEGYIEDFKEIESGRNKAIKVYLKYENKKSVISQIKRVSRPGRRVYRKQQEIPSALGGYGVTIVSTPSGILTDREAKEKGSGGEVMGMVW